MFEQRNESLDGFRFFCVFTNKFEFKDKDKEAIFELHIKIEGQIVLVDLKSTYTNKLFHIVLYKTEEYSAIMNIIRNNLLCCGKVISHCAKHHRR